MLAGTDASPSAIAAARSAAGTDVTIRRAAGSLDTQALATRLAAEGYDTIVAVGADARAAVSQAAGSELGDANTVWRTR